MGIHIFVSSTSEDLKEHCRPVAIGVINRKKPYAVAEAMESWNEENIDPVKMCRDKVLASTHYLGIFAYRRGWVPNRPEIKGKSITEAEYDWAVEFGKRRYVLMPLHGTKYANYLFTQSIQQSEEDEKAQEAFRTRVKNGVCKFFEDLDDFKKQIGNMVNRWVATSGESLLDHFDHVDPSFPIVAPLTVVVPPSTPSTSQPTMTERSLPPELNYFQVGRIVNVGQFGSVMEIMRRKRNYAGACFLVYGPDGFGHDDLIENLRFGLSPSHQFISIPCMSTAGTNRIPGLIKKISSWINGKSDSISVASIPQLADLLKEKKLKTQDIVIKIGSVHKFEGGVTGFTEQFWQPLIQGLGDSIGHRLMVFITANDLAVNGCDHLLQDLTESPTKLDLAKILKFDRLQTFTNEDIEDWLATNFPNKPKNEIAGEVADIISETGGLPEKVYKMLRDILEALN